MDRSLNTTPNDCGSVSVARTLAMTSRSSARHVRVLALAIFVLTISACGGSTRRNGVPAGAQAVLDTSIEDIDAGRYEKVYHEAADEWRNQSTLDESKATFKTLRDKLGNVRTRNLQTAREEEGSAGPIRGHSLVVVYQTSFEHGNGMENLTLLEHGGRWYLGRYFVSSSELK